MQTCALKDLFTLYYIVFKILSKLHEPNLSTYCDTNSVKLCDCTLSSLYSNMVHLSLLELSCLYLRLAVIRYDTCARCKLTL